MTITLAQEQSLGKHFDHSLTVSAYDDEDYDYPTYFSLICNDCDDVEVAREEA